jgi:hypothetical protein
VCTALAVLLAVLLGVSGCDLAARADRSREAETGSTSTASQPPPTSTSKAPARGPSKPHTGTVALDGVSLSVSAREAVVVENDAPGLQKVTLSLAPGGSADLALTSPGALDVDTDGSITVLDGNGTPVAAVGPPAPPSGTEDDAPRIEVTDIDATHARVEVDDPIRPAQGSGATGKAAPTGPLQVTFVAGTQAIDSATWGENEGGRSLAVDPTDWARHAGQAGVDLIRTQLVAAEPDAGTSTMGDQLVCHAVGAPDKATWNLEPWRPDVGLILTATAQCNPV